MRRFEFRLLQPVLGFLLCAGAFLYESEPAASMPTEIEAVGRQGVAAAARAKLERVRLYLANAEREEAVVAADRLLGELQVYLVDPASSSDQAAISAASAEELARVVIGLRNRAIQELSPLPTGSRGAFLASLLDGAVYADWRFGVPASVTLAQAALESNWGRSAPGYNLFGMKGIGPAGGTQRKVPEYIRHRKRLQWHTFRAYHSVDGSLEDHAQLLATGRHYARARMVQEDPDAYARALQGVYATDPVYARKLSKMMTSLNLRVYNWFDASPLATPPLPKPAPLPDRALAPDLLDVALNVGGGNAGVVKPGTAG